MRSLILSMMLAAGLLIINQSNHIQADPPNKGKETTQEKPAKLESKNSSRDAVQLKLMKALNEKHDFQFVEVPLEEVAHYLSDLLSIPVVLDARSLDDEGYRFDMPVSFTGEQITTRSMLHHLFKQSYLDLGWTTRNESLVIGSHWEMEESQVTQLYPVNDFVPHTPPATAGELSPFGRDDDVGDDMGGFGMETESTADEGRYDDMEHLIQVLQYPSNHCWSNEDGEGGAISPLEFQWGNLISVKHNLQAQQEVTVLLETLRMIDSANQVNKTGSQPVDSIAQLAMEYQEIVESARTKHEEALKQKISLEFLETPLNEVIRFLSETTKIPFQLDIVALEDEGIAPGNPMTFACQDISLQSALKLLFSSTGDSLDYVLDYEVLTVTTEIAAEEMMRVQVYDVSDLIAQNEIPATLLPEYSSGVYGGSSFGYGSDFNGGFGGTSPNMPQQGSGGGLFQLIDPKMKPASDTSEALMPSEVVMLNQFDDGMAGTGGFGGNYAVTNWFEDAIMKSTPGPWELNDGTGGAVIFHQTHNARVLIVRQTRRNHEAVTEFLTSLRELKSN
ncbi:hypothetical protein [Rubinisphaera italica]|uniref:Uncharacterized protein n=1 Tax=Rubinisphaera italica TaxID=2527969 RepID=A0A5C5XI97_9PLAN|nr:hypothetical protein [Rubinisphaera italica]TWT62439.1 hypothetical protein Pan54_31810 [Rubinisphaera italica]